MTAGYPPISDYAVIGDCRTAALISRDGSIDWLCLPRFDGPAVFAALLDRDRGGSFSVRPTGRFAVRRRYLDDSNVLETVFETASGRARLRDLMPVLSEAEKQGELIPDHQILRVLEGESGEVEFEVRCRPRPDYGRVTPRFSVRGALGLCWTDGPETLYLRSEVPLEAGPRAAEVSGRFRLAAGERRALSLTAVHDEIAVLVPLGPRTVEVVERTTRWWRDWASRIDYDGPARELVIRSALVLKLMTYAPSGAVVAAPTTSLPEEIGGVRNWDYRYCWLRDAPLTFRALAGLGCRAEAEAFGQWMTHSTRLTWPELHALYDVHGELAPPERDLDWLEGYTGSRPVRIGNGARHQLQLDVYGEVTDAAFEWVQRHGRLDRVAGRFLAGLGETVCRRWHEPDEGIWETRAGRQHHTYSKVMCWVALDRLLRLHEAGALPASIPVDRFRRTRERIRHTVEREGFNARLDSYVSVLGGDDLDASLLLLARQGFENPSSPRMRGTCQAVLDRLSRNGLVYRYLTEDGVPGGEGAFGLCSFWAVDCLCRIGRVEEATARFDALCGLANDVGLFAEEIEPETGRHLGNFPQAYTHVGLIDAALTVAEHCGPSAGAATPAESPRDTPPR